MMPRIRVRDPAPEIRAVRLKLCICTSYNNSVHSYYLSLQAGKVTPRGGGAKECIVSPNTRPPTPEQVKKFRGATRPAPGEKRILHSFAGDPPPNPSLRHGVVTKTSLEVYILCLLHVHHMYTVYCCSGK